MRADAWLPRQAHGIQAMIKDEISESQFRFHQCRKSRERYVSRSIYYSSARLSTVYKGAVAISHLVSNDRIDELYISCLPA